MQISFGSWAVSDETPGFADPPCGGGAVVEKCSGRGSARPGPRVIGAAPQALNLLDGCPIAPVQSSSPAAHKAALFEDDRPSPRDCATAPGSPCRSARVRRRATSTVGCVAAHAADRAAGRVPRTALMIARLYNSRQSSGSRRKAAFIALSASVRCPIRRSQIASIWNGSGRDRQRIGARQRRRDRRAALVGAHLGDGVVELRLGADDRHRRDQAGEQRDPDQQPRKTVRPRTTCFARAGAAARRAPSRPARAPAASAPASPSPSRSPARSAHIKRQRERDAAELAVRSPAQQRRRRAG